ncbi:hypothetical protein MHU86_869 [Fragilaria crotonensis]|nr:hypothetical protein MHU86_869 [Fragilaria crotonensis]
MIAPTTGNAQSSTLTLSHSSATSSIGAHRGVDASNADPSQQSTSPGPDSDDHDDHDLSDENNMSGGGVNGARSPHHPIAEFLYQLTKMLTENNNEIVEWTNGKIRVHHPDRLEGEVLHKYFRHSKFASFQRQLNYFGFRKIAGKGKMSPCSYVNDSATTDLRSLLRIKRKTNGSAARKAAMAQRTATVSAHGQMGMGIGLHGGMQMPVDMFTQAYMGSHGVQQGLGMFSGMMFSDPQHQAALQQAAALQHQALQNSSQNQQPMIDSMYMPGQKQTSHDVHGLSKKAGLAGSLEHLQQLSAARNSALNLASFGWTPGSVASMNSLFAPSPAPQSASMPMPPPAVPSMPATVAMNATAAANAAASNQGTNVFESNVALNALVGNNNTTGDAKPGQNASAPSYSGGPSSGQAPGPAPGPYPGGGPMQYPGLTMQRLSSSNLLRGLPSAGTMFPDSLSSVSLSGLLPGMGGMSSNRLNSMLSLSSFLSRDPSMADLLPGASNVNLSNLGGGAQYGNGYNANAPYSNGFNSGGLGGTTLVPLTGGSSQFDFAGASAALQSLANAANPASALLCFTGQASQNTTANAPAPNAASNQQAGAPLGFEPTPIHDIGRKRQKFTA